MWLILCYTVQLVITKLVPNFKILGQVVPEKSLTENFIREKEKWTNKGTDKQYVADSLLHSTTCHYQHGGESCDH